MSVSYGKKEDTDLEFMINLSRAYLSVHRNICQVFTKHGLTSAQFAVLEILFHKGDLTVGQIVKSILTTSGNITVVIKNLEKDGLVTRKTSEEDRRVGIISITEEGRKLIENVFPEQLEAVMESFQPIEEENKKFISSELHKLW
ncbi:MarR family winged helix-turn-helix transcriptional regulator [Gallicola sp. Sow4_E12]|uniref:MarR family winged helix-turn-helix transcriptional regulator n=1 Tax=Gallicola sp. Sow4_E12 TaxID=3438785 RepID=UPI003F8DBB18